MNFDELNKLLITHCQKVLPLVYDDSLSYYELECKILKIIQDFIKYQTSINSELSESIKKLFNSQEELDYYIKQSVQENVSQIMNVWKTDGTLENLVASYFQKRLLANRARTTLFAINRIPNTDWRTLTYAVQGFCVMKTKKLGEAEDYVVTVFRTGDDTSKSIIVCRGLTTGTVKWTTEAAVGHGNSCTWKGGGLASNFGKVYVAVSGDPTNGVVAIDGSDGTVLTTYNLTEKSEPPTAICWSETLEAFIFRSGKNLYKADSTFTNVTTITNDLYRDPNPFYQGMWCDNTYIYQCNGHWLTAKYNESYVRQQFVDVHFLDGTFYKRIKMDSFLEIEEGDFTSDGECVIQGNYRSQGWLYWCSIYENLTTYESDRKTYLVDYLNSGQVRTININEEYDGFFVDGSNSRPLPSVIYLQDYFINTVTQLTINLLSDITQNINIKRANCNIQINANNHKVHGFYFSNVNHVSVKNAIINGKNDFENSLLTCFRPMYIALNNVTFKNEDLTKPSRNIHVVGQLTLFLTNVTFESPATMNLDATEGAFVYSASLTDNTVQSGTDCTYSIGNASSVFESKGTVKQMLYQIAGSENMQLLRPLSPAFAVDSNKIRLGCTLHVSTTYNHNFHVTLDVGESPISLITDRMRILVLRQQLITKKGSDYITRVRYFDGTDWSSWKTISMT